MDIDISLNGPEVQIISGYIDSPLHWAVNVAPDSQIKSIEDLRNKTIGISRYGSGSHLMTYLMADQRNWDPNKELTLEVKGGIEDLVNGVLDHSTDAFLWETFTVKPWEEKGKTK
jgi:ABC-type nitrate/sulfonate/bicarbonate transport system substrate-binding protein